MSYANYGRDVFLSSFAVDIRVPGEQNPRSLAEYTISSVQGPSLSTSVWQGNPN